MCIRDSKGTAQETPAAANSPNNPQITLANQELKPTQHLKTTQALKDLYDADNSLRKSESTFITQTELKQYGNPFVEKSDKVRKDILVPLSQKSPLTPVSKNVQDSVAKSYDANYPPKIHKNPNSQGNHFPHLLETYKLTNRRETSRKIYRPPIILSYLEASKKHTGSPVNPHFVLYRGHNIYADDDESVSINIPIDIY